LVLLNLIDRDPKGVPKARDAAPPEGAPPRRHSNFYSNCIDQKPGKPVTMRVMGRFVIEPQPPIKSSVGAGANVLVFSRFGNAQQLCGQRRVRT
jgi:hypothetical protein